MPQSRPVSRRPLPRSDTECMQLADLIDRLRERVRIRRLQIKPIFQDYDRKAVNKTISKFCHKVGCVTRAQFRQALAIALGGQVGTHSPCNTLTTYTARTPVMRHGADGASVPAWPRKARRDGRASQSSLRLEAELATPGKQHTDRSLSGVPSI